MLQTIGLFMTYMLPVFALFYLAMDVYTRNPKKTEYRLVSLVILSFMLMVTGEYIRQLVPIEYSSTIVNYWIANAGVCGICWGMHFHFKISKLADRLPKWIYLSCSYVWLLPGLYALFFRKNVYSITSFYRDGIWIRPVFNEQYYIALTIGISTLLIYCSLLVCALLHVTNPKEKKRLTVLLMGSVSIFILNAALGYFKYENLPPYPYIFTDIVWVCFLRWSMVMHNFLPSHTSRFHTLFELTSAPVVVCDEFGRVIEMNPAATILLGETCHTLFDRCSKGTKVKFAKFYKSHFQSREKFAEFEIELKNAEGETFLAVLDADFIEFDIEYNAILLIRDVTEHDRYKKHLEFLAYHDSLTGLPDRKLFTKTLKELLEQRGTTDKPTVLYLDGDGFKQINDTLGHDTGDKFLILFAERIKACIGNDEILSRFGGDEFVLLMPKVQDEYEVIERARGILQVFRTPFFVDGKEFYVTCSIGICICDETINSASTAIRYADMAMYDAKGAGKNTFRIFEPKILRTVLLENQLRKALENKEFYLEFQPLVRIGLWRVSGFEALIRWNHPQFGVIPPSEFVPLAEKTGAIVDIGRWVLETALMEIKAKNINNIMLGVNVSSRQIREESFVDSVSQLLNSSGFNPKKLVIEITESALIENTEIAIERLYALKKLGIQLAIDDFGTGFSSLSYITQFPIDIVKIDRSFVQGILMDNKKRTVMRALMAMCKTLGIVVVVEGVEHVEQMKLLQEFGCDVAQGYLFGKPMRSEFMPDFVQEPDKAAY